MNVQLKKQHPSTYIPITNHFSTSRQTSYYPGSHGAKRNVIRTRIYNELSPHRDCLGNGSNGQTSGGATPSASQASLSFTSLLSPPSSSVVVKRGPCFLTEKQIQAFETECLREFLRISCFEHKTKDWVRSKINSLPGLQEPLLATARRQTCVVRACHTPRQPLQIHSTGHLGGWATPLSAEETLDGQYQRVDNPCPCQNCLQGPPAGKTGRGSLPTRPSTTACNCPKKLVVGFLRPVSLVGLPPDEILPNNGDSDWRRVAV